MFVAMKDRKKRRGLLRFFVVFLFVVFITSTLRSLFTERFPPRLLSRVKNPPLDVIAGEVSGAPTVLIRETVIFPDQELLFLKYPHSTPLFSVDELQCVYLSPNSSHLLLELPPLSIDREYETLQIVRCPLRPSDGITTLSVTSYGHLPPGPTYRWDHLAYEALIDRDNTTVVFVKGLNLRSGKSADPSRFKCVYAFDYRESNFTLWSDAISVAQEVIRCKTPSTVLINLQRFSFKPVTVSIRLVGGKKMKSVARLNHPPDSEPLAVKQHHLCVCTMLRNQARFLREWVIYHARIGVERWFLYDNNSNDETKHVIESLMDDYNVTRHVWPWVKSQEAGFSRCALTARTSCEWIGFIDVDEFIHLTSDSSLLEIVTNGSVSENVAELRVPCNDFGLSGLTEIPSKGVMAGYTCRMAGSERHKSIVNPEGLHTSLINLVHHFHLKPGFRHVNMNKTTIVINHYKYQVWKVFKEKFYRRVATYVSDWSQEKNVASKDRAPGLGTKAIEPADWSTRFCEVNDTRLRDKVIKTLTDTRTGRLPWEED